MRAGLVALLTSESTVSALVGSRVYVNKAPQAVYSSNGTRTPKLAPHVVITEMGTEENESLDGSGELRFMEFDIDCKADRSVDAEGVANAVRLFLQNYTGPAGEYTVAALHVQDEIDGYEPPTDQSDVGVHVVTIDVRIDFNP